MDWLPTLSLSFFRYRRHDELSKHADARKKTDLAVKDIEKQLKALLLAHHSAIKDLKFEEFFKSARKYKEYISNDI